ncbi:MAG: hypothetical protein HOQ03_12555, partial [Thermoleophilia bacterium]|nr:hypothetical protein [Thermoleophilia bacterium]
EGTIDVHEYSEWLITAGYRAANMGLPYLPWLTSRHTDIGRELGLKEVECPFTGTPLLAVRAIELDVAVIHAVRCDAAGNAELALPLDHMYDVDALIARCASTVIVCAEEIGPVDANRVQLVAREVDAVVEAPRGAWPGAMRPLYEVDRAHVTETYLPAASGGDFAGYLERYVFSEAGP